ncbi:MAG TPA: hypothetical protein VFV31_04810, partial [Chitinophagaceae bacterium]|nr:hypothetical protein [Chitinophagaceae bacterium]
MKKIFLFLFLQNCLLISISQVNNTPLSAEQREVFIQRATELRKNEDYKGAILQLDSILLSNKTDAPILLFKGDLLLQAKRFDEAAVVYKRLLPLNFEQTIATINLSYALFMDHQPANALKFAKEAWSENKSNPGAIVNYFNALLWNIRTKEAAVFLNAQQDLLSQDQQLVLKARLYTTSGNYNAGLNFYDSLVKSYPNKYYVQEFAEVLLGKKEIKRSSVVIKQNDSLFSANEYNVFTQKINAAQQQNAGTEFSYFKDVAKNIRIENSVWWQQQDGRTYRFRLSAGTSRISSAQNEKINAQFANVTINERWNKAWSGETNLHLQVIKPVNNKSFTGITGKQTLQYQPNDRRMFGIYYQTEILNFTAELLGKNIRSHTAGYITHLMLSGKTGFYSQGSTAALTDKNQRFQFFGSLYHLFRTEPTLKAGINFSALHFKDSSIKTYFSPNRYL